MKFLAAVLPVLFVVPAFAGVEKTELSRYTTGGGYTNAGLQGEYFSNPDLSGSAAFSRKEVRIDFDWGTSLPIGGSIAEPYRSFPHNGFSVRWSGTVIPRFSEEYQFRVDADDGVRLKMKPEGAPAWTTLVDRWAAAGEFRSPAFRMEAGKPCEIQIEYHNTFGPAKCRLFWQSPSTPEEVVDILTENGLNLASFHGYCFADKAREGRYWKINGQEPKADLLDEFGNPKGDFEFIVGESSKSLRGTWLIQFKGKAALKTLLFTGTFLVNGKEVKGALPRGEGYDAATNTTRVELNIPVAEGSAWLGFTETSRDGSDNLGTGVSHLRITRPISVDSSTPHQVDEIGYRPLKSMAECFTTLRWLGIANEKFSGKWEDRTPPSWFQFIQPRAKDENRGENWEYLVMLANETGRDLEICTPILADNAYFDKLARLLRYGSDGVDPYSAPEGNPKYPPLNPNLRVYVEVGNEIWNWSFKSTQDAKAAADKEIKDGTEESKVFNYNGKGNYRAWHALRTVRASDIFRSVFGDNAMGHRVRFLIEYQYNNAQQTATQSFQFIDAFFNNGDGDHVPQPHPVSYYVWGAGGAAYYGVGNAEGKQDETVVNDASFEQVPVSEGQLRTASPNSPWKLSGSSAIFRNFSSAVAAYTPGKQLGLKSDMAVGFKFRTGPKPIYVYRLGRVYTRASEGARMAIVREDNKQLVTEAKTAAATAYLTKVFGYYMTPILEKPAQLEPNTVYYLVSAENAGTGWATDDTTTAKPGPGITILNAAKATITDAANPSTWNFEDGAEGNIFGPVSFFYAFQPDLALPFPQPPDGQQAAVIAGNAEISQDVVFMKPGEYTLTFNATWSKGWIPPFFIYANDQNISPMGQGDHRASDKSSTLGGWGRNNGFREEWGSAVFRVDKPGPNTIRFAIKSNKPEQYVVIDNVRITSVDAIMESGFGSGAALGQPEAVKWNENQLSDSQLAMAFGLPRVAYESGWSLGGDFYQKPIQNYCKFMDPRGQAINDAATNTFQRAGGRLNVWGVYPYWPSNDFTNGREYPIMKSIIASGNRLPAEQDNGLAVPASLTPENSMKWISMKPGAFAAKGDWLTWIVVCPATAEYEFAVGGSGDGPFELEADGNRIAKAKMSDSEAVRVRLTKGMHGVRIRAANDGLTLQKIAVRPEAK